MINRKIATKVLELSSKYPIIVVTGPRQSGKSTLVKTLFPNKSYISLEDPDVRLFAESDPRTFLSNYPDGAILDEVQRVPELFSYLQTIVDASDKTGMFILSGSQNFLLMEKITQSLAGRVALFKLLPFSYSEIQHTEFEQNSINELIFKGLYPRLYDKNINPIDFYPNYIQTYLERDVKTLKNVSDLSLFTRFLKLCAARIGTVLNYSSLANDCGVAVNTIKSWISVLEASYVLYLLPPHFENFNKRLTKSPKMYFYDTGLACSLLNIQEAEQVESHYLRGGLFENLVLTEILKFHYNQGKEAPCYFWQDQVGKEVDILVETPNLLKVFEVKSSMTMSKDFFKNLKYWKSLANEKVQSSEFVIYAGTQRMKTQSGEFIRLEDLEGIL